jgi:hypothetical protein
MIIHVLIYLLIGAILAQRFKVVVLIPTEIGILHHRWVPGVKRSPCSLLARAPLKSAGARIHVLGTNGVAAHRVLTARASSERLTCSVQAAPR